MRRVLVTGATGFVGANLAHRLLEDGHQVHLLVRPTHRSWRIEQIIEHVVLHVAPLEDPEAVGKAVKAAQPDWVFNLAAHGAYATQTNVQEMVATNLIGTVNLVRASLRCGFEALVHTGSSSEYGFKDHAPSEEEWLEPNSDYAVTKASATLFCRSTGRRLGAHIVTLRLSSVYGPWEEPTRLIPTLAVRGLRGELPLLVGPETARDFVYVDDVVDAYLLAAGGQGQEPGAVYNVGTGVQTSVGEMVAVARRLLGITVEPEWGTMPPRLWDTSTWVANAESIRTQLGWYPRHSVVDGFGRFVDWLHSSPELDEMYLSAAARPNVSDRPTT